MNMMLPTLRRLRAWYHRQDASSKAHRGIQVLLLLAAAAVLVVPFRPGAKAVIPLFGTHHVGPVAAQTVRATPTFVRVLDFAGEEASADAQRLAQWVVAKGDNGTLNFAILDKKNAKVFVFAPSGKLIGASPVLLGYAAGDDSVAGIGKRPIADVQPAERTTPAGRFRAEPGRNAVPEDVLWVDYEAAVSMHRVRLTNPAEHRAERLQSPNVKDRRISYGCINMPPAFFEQVLWPNFRRQGGVVYVLPEVKALEAVFPGLAQSANFNAKSSSIDSALT